MGLLAMSAGIQALNFDSWAQFNLLLWRSGDSAWASIVMMFVGVSASLLAFTRGKWLRFMAALGSFLVWTGIAILFAKSEVSEQPLYSGLVLAVASIIIMVSIIRDEKFNRCRRR